MVFEVGQNENLLKTRAAALCEFHCSLILLCMFQTYNKYQESFLNEDIIIIP